jgi:hypothetical protein
MMLFAFAVAAFAMRLTASMSCSFDDWRRWARRASSRGCPISALPALSI